MNIKSLIGKLVTEEMATLFEQQGGFKFHIFKKLPTGKQMEEYAEKYLPYLGHGISRTAFAWKAGKVLKVARTYKPDKPYGAHQNRQEVEALTNADYAEILPKLIDYDKENYAWILVEAVKTLDKNVSLKSQLKITTSKDFMLFFSSVVNDHPEWPLEDKIKDALEDANALSLDKPLTLEDATEFDLKLLKLIEKYLPMGFEDTSRIDHWGMTVDGRLVMVDVGLAEL